MVLLQKSQPANYDGVLMPSETFRNYETDHLNAQLYRDELKKHEGAVPLYTTPDGSTLVLIGIGGAVLGYVIGVTTR
jgi:hypothetical protein